MYIYTLEIHLICGLNCTLKFVIYCIVNVHCHITCDNSDTVTGGFRWANPAMAHPKLQLSNSEVERLLLLGDMLSLWL